MVYIGTTVAGKDEFRLAKYSVIRLKGLEYFNEQKFRRTNFLEINHW